MSRFFGRKQNENEAPPPDRVEREGHGSYKEFWLTSFAVDHPTSVLVLTFSVILAGLVSYIQVPKEAAPEITVPYIAVNTIYPGVAPEDIETLITREIEDELNKIGDVKEITSTSVEGYSSVVVEFEAGMDMTEALQLVREKVDIAKPELPEAAEEPMIIEFNFAEFPIMQVNISGEYSLVRLKQLAEDIEDRIEQIPAVLEVTLSGGLEREVQVDVDLAKLKYYGLAFGDVIDAIREENVTTPGGTIDVGDLKYLVRVPGEFQDTRLIEDIVITSPGDRPVYIRDVASVDFGFKERDSYARLDGSPVVTLSISKRVGENIIETADAVKAAVEEMRPDFPPTTVVKITSDMSEDVHHMVSSLENNIISGLIFVVAILLFALGIRNASFVGVAIPLSMLLSFSVIQMSGMTMNFIVLFSLILALGMLVDNAIVIVENIYRFREEGYDKKEAAKLATGEVAMPVIAATATTLAAFAPMAFWPGIVGEFMGYLPKTLIITLSSSLFVALVINPTLCSLWMRPEGEKGLGLTREMKWTLGVITGVVFSVVLIARPLPAVLLALTVIFVYSLHRWILAPAAHWLQTLQLPATLRWYEGVLRWALAHRLRVMLGSLGALVLAVFLFGAFSKGVVFFPEDIPPSTVYVQVEAPTGTRVEVTDEIVRRIETQLRDLPGSEDFESVVATVGSSSGIFGGQSGTHLATVAVNFVDYELRQHDVFETLERMRSTIGEDIAGADIVVERPQEGPPTGLPVTIEIVGEDADRLKELGDRAVAILSNSGVAPKLEGLESDMADARPELTVEVDREKAKLFGLNTQKIGFTVRSAINGVEAGEYRDGENEYDIVVRLAKRYRNDVSSLADLNVVAEDGSQVPLPSIADWRINQSFSGINRKDLDRVVTVSSDVRSGYNANAVLAEVQSELAGFARDLPKGYTLRYAGQQEEQDASAAFLFGAFFTAMLLIAFILVSQFDSVLRPLIILSSVILSTIGVLIGLTVFQMPFGIIMSGVGVISLAGIVVNNAIVLIDYIKILRERDGMGQRESLVQGGITRFRPVTLTAITTVVGLIPLAIGMNIDFYGFYRSLEPNFYWGGEQAAWWGPMAIAVICGLTFATFLTLILVPVMHSYTDDIAHFFQRHFSASRDQEEAEEARSAEEDIGVPETVTA
ncbi:MAG: efflux RND transporter permease subunit [Gemmatimonadetes bacterium]|uniref:Efflux RND transporter permease subunit n=1 Tax=Candidatus Kutchimonas denitrificans TaxID=3056748 RepID=A0AAE4Z9N6_9BACT|nr:efflux RND transporter permease subunit [Gemmatimonadota bacterium]NIR76340.1 efflux RND transporter permease subunit [Candidatus Kutchimonas denitrificans]NIS02363.1 efflux RND transporter permease subunit [Gemmatimonadota bacterium]NIT68182.1 efflux RND transporter permease subunit [Gemmatimonadota bacterium]NIU54406.1 MMPL family transporter [Gemmatimonadota bacterium]